MAEPPDHARHTLRDLQDALVKKKGEVVKLDGLIATFAEMFGLDPLVLEDKPDAPRTEMFTRPKRNNLK